MPDIPGIPESLANVPGVQMTPPPVQYMEQTMGVISAAVAKIGEGERGKLVWIATSQGRKIGVNAAVVSKIGNHVTVTAWIGSKWGEPIEAGIVGEVKW